MEIKITALDNIRAAAREFLQATGLLTSGEEAAPRSSAALRPCVFAFYGAMGAGKTTFVKALCVELGVEDVVNSPTFAIVNEYHSDLLDGPVYHFDFYRIRRLSEAYDMGAEEYFYSGAPCFVEWPELIEELLPAEALAVTITEQPDGTRLVTA